MVRACAGRCIASITWCQRRSYLIEDWPLAQVWRWYWTENNPDCLVLNGSWINKVADNQKAFGSHAVEGFVHISGGL